MCAGIQCSFTATKYVPIGEHEHRKHNWETNVIINPQKVYHYSGAVV